MLQRGLFESLKGSLGQLVKDQRKIPARDTPAPFGSILIEAIEETVEILVPTDVKGGVPQLINNGCFIGIYRSQLKFLLLKQVQEEIYNLLYSGSPEVHLV